MCLLGRPLKSFSLSKVAMGCTFWGGKGECRVGMGGLRQGPVMDGVCGCGGERNKPCHVNLIPPAKGIYSKTRA